MIQLRRPFLVAIILFQLSMLVIGHGIGGGTTDIQLTDSLKATLLPQHAFKTIPPGNYSGLAYLGNDLYAVVSDKGERAGFYIFHIALNTRGEIIQIDNRGFTELPGNNQDEEAIAYDSVRHHIYIGNEASAEIIDYDCESRMVVRKTTVEDYRKHAPVNRGIESLTYDGVRQKLFTINESPLIIDNGLLLRLKQFDLHLDEEKQYSYLIDEPLEDLSKPDQRHAYGVSELTALSDGTLLVLEREVYIRPLYLNSWVMNKLFRIKPGNPQKQFVAGWRTWLRLGDMDFADYEGMCEGPLLPDGRRVIVLCADSQNQAKGVLKDYFRTIVVEPYQKK